MQHPPRAPPDPDARGAAWDQEIGPDLDERITPFNQSAGYDLVHFDLDVLNILVGDFVGPDHQTLPVFKVSDFGLAERSTRPDFNRAYVRSIQAISFYECTVLLMICLSSRTWAYEKRRAAKYRLYLPVCHPIRCVWVTEPGLC